MKRKLILSLLCAMSGAALAVAWIAAASSAVPVTFTPAALDTAPIDDPRAGGYGMELVEQYFGYYYGGVIKGDKAYISVGQRFYIFSLANPASPALLGKSNLLHNPSSPLDVEGSYAYLADPGIAPYATSPGAGLHVMSISNPYLPDEVYFHPAEDYGYIDLDVYNGYAYIVDGGGYLRILSLANPAAPTLVKSLLLNNGASYIEVAQHPLNSKTYAYINSDGSTFYVVDVSDPAQAAIAGSLDLPVYSLGDLAIQGTRALLTDFDYGNLHLLDVSNPAAPALVASTNFSYGKSIYGIEWNGNYALGRQYGANSGVVVLDTTVAGLPVEVGFFPYTNSAGSFSLAAGQVNGLDLGLVADTTGLHVVNATNPTAPQLIGVYQDEGAIYKVQTAGELVYLSGEQGLRIYQRTAPGNLEPLGAVDQPGELGLVQDGKAYLGVRSNYDWNGTFHPSRLVVVDVANPANPQPLDSLELSFFEDIVVYGGNAYLASGSSLQIVDASNPNNLSLTAVYTGGVGANHAFYSVAVAPNPDTPSQLLAYLADVNKGLVILDVTQPQSIAPVLTLTTNLDGARALEFTQLAGETGSYLAIAGENFVALLDITHPLSPNVIANEYTSCRNYHLTTRPGKIYVACDLGGVRLYLANSSSLEWRGYYRYPYQVFDVAISSDPDFFYTTARSEGLFEVWQALVSYTSLPITGGIMTSEYYTLTLTFASDTFTNTKNIYITPRYFGNMPGSFSTIGSKYFFDLSISSASDLNEPMKPYQVAWQYDPLNFPGVDESTLGLYYWDGVGWVREPSSSVNTAANTVSATPQHASLWALLAERQGVQHLYLPLINR